MNNNIVINYINQIENLLNELKKNIVVPTSVDLDIKLSSYALQDIFLDVDLIIDFYISSVGFPVRGANISRQTLKIKVVKFLEKNTLSISLIMSCLENNTFSKNISVDKFLLELKEYLFSSAQRTNKRVLQRARDERVKNSLV